MRPALFVMLSSILLAVPAAAQVTEPTDKKVEAAPPAQAAAATPATEPPGKPAQAQAPEKDTDHQETLFGDGKIESGGYGGPELKIGRVAAGDAVFFGGKGGWIINHHFVLGGGGWGMTNRRDAPERLQPLTGQIRSINIGYGGGLLEYFIRPEKMVHGTVGVLVGGGSINLHDRDANCHEGGRCMEPDEDEDLRDSFFIAEPEAGLEVNAVKFMRVNAGVAYRFVTGVGGIGFENDDLRGLSGTLTVRFGAF